MDPASTYIKQQTIDGPKICHGEATCHAEIDGTYGHLKKLERMQQHNTLLRALEMQGHYT